MGATRPEEVVLDTVGGAPGFKAKLGRTAATGREEATGRTDTATVLGGGSFPKKLKEFIERARCKVGGSQGGSIFRVDFIFHSDRCPRVF